MRHIILLALVIALFAPGPLHAEGYRLLSLEGRVLKWGAPEFGSGSTVTYGFVQGEQSFDDAINCRQLVAMDKLLSRWSIDLAEFEAAVGEAFAIWSRAADLQFRRARGEEQADIMLGGQAVPRGIAFANVSYDIESAADGLASLEQALICLNPLAPWQLDERADGPKGFSLPIVLAHEIGHAIGLDHPGPSGQLMGYSYQEEITGLMPGDIAGAQRLYGPPSPHPVPKPASPSR